MYAKRAWLDRGPWGDLGLRANRMLVRNAERRGSVFIMDTVYTQYGDLARIGINRQEASLFRF